MVYKIKFLEDVREEFAEILYFITYIRRLKSYAEKVRKNMRNEIKILKTSPEIYPFFNKRDKYGYEYRKMVVDKRYIVLYYVDYDDRIVYIAHIYDGRSNYVRRLV